MVSTSVENAANEQARRSDWCARQWLATYLRPAAGSAGIAQAGEIELVNGYSYTAAVEAMPYRPED